MVPGLSSSQCPRCPWVVRIHLNHLLSFFFFSSPAAHCDLMYLLNFDFLSMKLLIIPVCYLYMLIVCLGLGPADHLIAQL